MHAVRVEGEEESSQKVSDGLKQPENRHGFAKLPSMHAVRVEGEEQSSQRSAMD
jgi:hypothetical protein